MRIYGDILVNVDYRIFFFFFLQFHFRVLLFGLFTSFLPSSICRSICRAVKASLNQFAQVPMPVFFFFFVRLQRQKECHPLSVIFFFFYQDADPTKLERREITTYASLAGVPKPTKNCRLLRKSNVVKSRRFIFFKFFFNQVF